MLLRLFVGSQLLHRQSTCSVTLADSSKASMEDLRIQMLVCVLSAELAKTLQHVWYIQSYLMYHCCVLVAPCSRENEKI